MSHRAERELRRIAQGTTNGLASLAHPPPKDPWLALRAAGSLGTLDLALLRGARTLLIEVKETGDVTKHGASVYLTANNARGIDQRDALYQACIDYDLSRHQVGFAVRRKGHLPQGVPRWTWHPLVRVEEKTVLRASDAYHLLPWLYRDAQRIPVDLTEVPA